MSELCVRRPVFATMLVMSLVLGIFSFRDLGVDLFPKADPATVNVSLSLPGSSPDEMATSVVEPMEETLSGIAGIDEIQARMNEGTATITVRFVLERDINDAANDVREKVASALKNVPPQLLPPVINKVDPDSDPVMSIVVSSPSMSLRTLTEIADKQIMRVIQTADGVGQVSMGGGRAREVHVVVDVQKLNAYGLSLTQVSDSLVSENVEIPGGAIEQGKGQLLLRTLGRVDVTEDFNNIVVATRNGTPIRVSDVGYAEDTFQRPTTAAWLADGTPAVVLDIRRAMGENTVAVIEGVRTKLATLQRTLPKAVTLAVIRDDSKFIYASVESLEEHLIYGSLFAAIVVMFFIRNIRAVIIASLAIPASIISSFTLMRIMGFTLNNMTLLGITLAVGIVIDDAIVVLENIFRYIEEKNCTPFEAAIKGTREVALAVMATTLSLVVIFLPIAFMTGYARRFINPFGLTMAFSILVSMIVSFTLTPMLSSRFLKLADAEADHKTKEQGFFHWLDNWYTGQVNWALDHPGVIIGVSIVTFLLTFPLNRMVGREFVPNEDMGEWTIHVDTPEGTSLEGTSEIGFQLAKEIVIMLVLPISVPFALLTLWATGRTLNLWSALGMLLLLGIVKKNSILQVDYANTLRAEGMPLREAIVEACRTRLRPILMTTFAIIAGLIPTALGIGIGGGGRAAIAVTVIGGQSLCLFLTLLLVPVAYVKFDALEQTAVNQGWRGLLARFKTPKRLTPAADARS